MHYGSKIGYEVSVPACYEMPSPVLYIILYYNILPLTVKDVN